MIPELMASERFHWGDRPRDVCCSAPTGSGKTLAFVIPIVQVGLVKFFSKYLLHVDRNIYIYKDRVFSVLRGIW